MKMYSGGYSNGVFAIGLATSTDGIRWNRLSSPVLTKGVLGSWDQDGVNAPCVIKEDGNYKMWYAGAQQPSAAIGYATSPDGIQWTKHPSNPVLTANPSNPWESFLVTDGRVVRIDTVYHMFYHGAPGAYGYQIGHATSVDGVSWHRTPQNPVLRLGDGGTWDDNSLSQHWVIYGDGIFQLWYGASDVDGLFQIGYATSPLTPLTVPPISETPTEFYLGQGFPNPFNPTTTIVYELPHTSHISLKIFDALGREVTTLVNEVRIPGRYTAVWNAEDLASGTYWYRMTAGDYAATGKLVLLK